MINQKYAPQDLKYLEENWCFNYVNSAIKEYSMHIKIRFSKKSYKDKVKQLIKEEFKYKRKGHYFSLGFIDQNCTLCKKCIRPLLCNNALSRPNWVKFSFLRKKYNLRSGEGIILIAPEYVEKIPEKIITSRLEFFDALENKFNVRLYCVKSKEIVITWKAVTQCLYGCRTFCKLSRLHSCPPFSLSPHDTIKIKNRFEYTLIIRKTMDVPVLNISWLGFNPIRDANQKLWCKYHFGGINRIGNTIEEYMNKRFDVYAFSATCNRCIICSYPKKCRKPTKMRFVPEGCGIDMYDLAKKLDMLIEIPPHKRVNLMDVIFFNR